MIVLRLHCKLDYLTFDIHCGRCGVIFLLDIGEVRNAQRHDEKRLSFRHLSQLPQLFDQLFMHSVFEFRGNRS